MVNLFGGTGYIGQRYSELFECVQQPRDDLVPVCAKVLYMISTNHNYNFPNNPYIDVDTNITTLIRVLENLRRIPNAEINFISSWFVYGPVKGCVDENATCDPRGFYSITKRTAEQLLIEYCTRHGMTWRILRLCNVIGGEDIKSNHQKNVVHALARSIVRHEPVTLINHGQWLRQYLHRDDACRAVHHVMSHAAGNAIYNIGNSQLVIFRDVIDYMIHTTGSHSVIENRPGDVMDCRMDCQRLMGLGWTAQYPWQQAMDDVLAHC